MLLSVLRWTDLHFSDLLVFKHKTDLVSIAFFTVASPEVEKDIGHECDVRDGVYDHPRHPRGVVVGEKCYIQW